MGTARNRRLLNEIETQLIFRRQIGCVWFFLFSLDYGKRGGQTVGLSQSVVIYVSKRNAEGALDQYGGSVARESLA